MARKPNSKYQEANINFLKTVASDPTTQTLPKGILYQVIATGEGTVLPKLSSIVSVHYHGTTIDGNVFDSTENNPCPETFRLREVIEGWQIALSHMHVGDKWKIFLPAAVAYGNLRIDGIPKGSTLIFEVELISIH